MDNIQITIGVETPRRIRARPQRRRAENRVAVTYLDSYGSSARASDSGSAGLDRYWTRYYSHRFRGIIEGSRPQNPIYFQETDIIVGRIW